MHQFDLKNKTAIITGGAQGFGLEIAKKFLLSGSKVFIWDIDEKELLKWLNSLYSFGIAIVYNSPTKKKSTFKILDLIG